MELPGHSEREKADALATLATSLRPIYDLEVSLGNSIAYVAVGAWSECPLAITMKKPLHFQAIAESLTLPQSVTQWRNDDPHYSIEAGFKCETTKHAIAGPLK